MKVLYTDYITTNDNNIILSVFYQYLQTRDLLNNVNNNTVKQKKLTKYKTSAAQ